MHRAVRKLYEYGQKALCVLLCIVLVLLCLASAAPRASADMFSDAYNTVTFYRWHRVYKQSDLPAAGTRCPVLIMWKSSSAVYYANGSYCGTVKYDDEKWDCVPGTKLTANYPNPFADITGSTDTFYSVDPLTSWEMYVTGDTDKDNGKVRQVRFFPVSNVLLTGWDDFDFPSGKTSADYDHWSIATYEKGGDYTDGLSYGECRIFANVSGADTGFMYSDDKLFGYCDYTYNYSKLAVYWAEKVTYTAITENYTIQEGQLMNVDSGVILMDDVTLTVEPNAYLSIEGDFVQNGRIENYGTMVLQPGAKVHSMDPREPDSGRIRCIGGQKGRNALTGDGSLLVMAGAELEFNRGTESRLILEKGANCICSGTIYSPNYLTLDNSTLRIRKQGKVNLESYRCMPSWLPSLALLQYLLYIMNGKDTSSLLIRDLPSSNGYSVFCSGEYAIIDENGTDYLPYPGLMHLSPLYDVDHGCELDIKSAATVTRTATYEEYKYPGGDTLRIMLTDGTQYWTYASGDTKTVYSDGRTVQVYEATLRSGETGRIREEEWPDGTHFGVDDATGKIEFGRYSPDAGVTWYEYVEGDGVLGYGNCRRTTYDAVTGNLAVTEEYENGMVYSLFRDGSYTVRDFAGRVVKSYYPEWNGARIEYNDRVEHYDISGRLTDDSSLAWDVTRRYHYDADGHCTGYDLMNGLAATGAAPMAAVEVNSALWYPEQGSMEHRFAVPNKAGNGWEDGTLIWKVSADGWAIGLRVVVENDRLVQVLQFSDGRTCTYPHDTLIEPEEYRYGADAGNYGWGYDETPRVLPAL